MPRVAADHERMRALGRHIAGRRHVLGMTQQQVAKAAGMDRSFLGAVENGQGNPSVDLFLRLADVLRIRAGDLLEGENLGRIEPAER